MGKVWISLLSFFPFYLQFRRVSLCRHDDHRPWIEAYVYPCPRVFNTKWDSFFPPSPVLSGFLPPIQYAILLFSFFSSSGQCFRDAYQNTEKGVEKKGLKRFFLPSFFCFLKANVACVQCQPPFPLFFCYPPFANKINIILSKALKTERECLGHFWSSIQIRSISLDLVNQRSRREMYSWWPAAYFLVSPISSFFFFIRGGGSSLGRIISDTCSPSHTTQRGLYTYRLIYTYEPEEGKRIYPRTVFFFLLSLFVSRS